MSGSYGSSNCHVYSACLHCVSDRKVYKQYLPVCSLLYKDCVRVLVCWFIVHYSWAHNFREILCRVSAVHLSRRRHAVPRNACNFQRLVVLVCVQLQSTFFSFWNELESLFNCIFHFNYIHTVPNNICLF